MSWSMDQYTRVKSDTRTTICPNAICHCQMHVYSNKEGELFWICDGYMCQAPIPVGVQV